MLWLPKDIVPPKGVIPIRDRIAPLPKMTARLEGWITWRLIDREGREHSGGQTHNLILDQGLDQVASVAILGRNDDEWFLGIGDNIAVGTDGTAPTVSDTGLGAEVDRTNNTNQRDAIDRPSDGTYEITRFFEFDFADANGNLTEFGVSNSASAGSNLFNRELFRDGGGTPEVVTKTSNDILRIEYTLRVILTPVTITAGSFTITNIGVINGDYCLQGGGGFGNDLDTGGLNMDLVVFSTLARGVSPNLSGASADPNGAVIIARQDEDVPAYSLDLTPDPVGDPFLSTEKTAAAAYTPGSFTRTPAQVLVSVNNANFEHRSYSIGQKITYNSGFSSAGSTGYYFKMDNADYFTKDNLHELDLGLPIASWSR